MYEDLAGRRQNTICITLSANPEVGGVAQFPALSAGYTG